MIVENKSLRRQSPAPAVKRAVHKTGVDWRQAVRVDDCFDSCEQILSKGLRANGLNAGQRELYDMFGKSLSIAHIAGRAAKMTGAMHVF